MIFENAEVTVIKSKRKTISIQIKPNYNFIENDFFCGADDVIHSSDPFHLVVCFEFFGDTLVFNKERVCSYV